MTKEEYIKYISYFNNKEYDKVALYLAPDVVVEYSSVFANPDGSARILKSREEFVQYYRYLHSYVNEYLELEEFISANNLLFATLYTEFYCFKQPPKNSGLNWKEGEVRVMTNWVLYNLENNIFKRIRIAHFRLYDPSTAKYFRRQKC